MQSPLTISAGEIAEALGRSVRWLKENRQLLEARHNMPAKLPGGANWSRLAITCWLATYGRPAEEQAAAREDMVASQRAALEATYGRAA